MKTARTRTQRGAMMGIIIASTLVFIILVVGIIQITMLFGGSREVANAVDAGTLNTGRLATTVMVDIQKGDEEQFADVAENNGKSFSLKSIDRMWAKCLMTMMNEKAMQTDGYSSGSSSSHAEQMFQAAKAISDRLASKLNDQATLNPFFNDVAGKESVRMLGNQATLKNDNSGWTSSLMDRGVESNIAIYSEQFPTGFDLNNTQTTTASDGKNYFKGYTPINVLNHDICFVPFKLKEQPHLVSGKIYEENTESKKPLPQWPTPVPNAFSCQGKTDAQTQGPQQSRSFVLTNPQKTYDMALLHNFIKIKLGDNTCHWYLNGTPFPDGSYEYFPPSTQWRGPMVVGTGTLEAQAFLGLEFVPPTVWQCITAIPGGDYSDLKKVLLQRCREMKHDFNDIEGLLGTLYIPGVKDYYIYPSDDGTELYVSPSPGHPVPPSWLNTGADPDGNSQEIASNDTFWFPNFVIPYVTGLGAKPLPSWCHCEDSVDWKPGTGHGGCLGEVKAEHETTCYANGAATLF